MKNAKRIGKAADSILERYSMFDLVRVQPEGPGVAIVVCNAFRVQKSDTGEIVCSRRNLTSGEWEPSRMEWYVGLAPVFRTRSFHDFATIIGDLFLGAYQAAGGDITLERVRRKDAEAGWAKWLSSHLGYERTSRMHYTMQPKDRRRASAIGPGLVKSAANTFRAAFFRHFVERDILSAVCAADGVVGVGYYIIFHNNGSAIRRISREHRNLLPLLRWIRVENWGDSDLFSARRWVNDGGVTDFEAHPAHGGVTPYRLGLKTRRGHRYLMRAPCSLLKIPLLLSGERVEILAEATAGEPRVPAIFLRSAIDMIDPVQIGPEYYGHAARVLRLVIRHMHSLWKERGFVEAKRIISHEDRAVGGLRHLFDFLTAEGFAQGRPRANDTLESLRRAERAWHEEIGGREKIEEFRQWTDCVGEVAVGGKVRFTPLTDSDALVAEGKEMAHCVRIFADRCVSGGSRIFSVKGPGDMRSTLEVVIGRGLPEIGQHYGYRNQPPDPALVPAAVEFLKLYREAAGALVAS